MSDKRCNGGHSSAAGGIGFLGLLTVAFVVLKLCKVISWSWAWVFSPILIPASIVGLILSVVLVGALLMMVADELKQRRGSK